MSNDLPQQTAEQRRQAVFAKARRLKWHGGPPPQPKLSGSGACNGLEVVDYPWVEEDVHGEDKHRVYLHTDELDRSDLPDLRMYDARALDLLLHNGIEIWGFEKPLSAVQDARHRGVTVVKRAWVAGGGRTRWEVITHPLDFRTLVFGPATLRRIVDDLHKNHLTHENYEDWARIGEDWITLSPH